MGLSFIQHLLSRLSLLREVDASIDLARGWLQLLLLISIGEKSVTISELMSITTLPRKAILDALRRMKIKGLVVEENGHYKLSRDGLRLYNILYSLVQPSSINCGELSYISTHIPLSHLIRFLYIHDAVLALGFAPRNELTLHKLAKIVKLSEKQLDKYLLIYSKKPLNIFKRYVRYCNSTYKRECIVYRLTQNGSKLLLRLPSYRAIKRSRIAYLLMKATRSVHPRIMVLRLSIALALVSIITLLSFLASRSNDTLLFSLIAATGVISSLIVLVIRRNAAP